MLALGEWVDFTLILTFRTHHIFVSRWACYGLISCFVALLFFCDIVPFVVYNWRFNLIFWTDTVVLLFLECISFVIKLWYRRKMFVIYHLFLLCPLCDFLFLPFLCLSLCLCLDCKRKRGNHCSEMIVQWKTNHSYSSSGNQL